MNPLAQTPDVDYQRGRLAAAIPISTHTAVRAGIVAMAAKRICLAVVFFLVCIPLLAATVMVLRQDRIDSAVWGGVFTLVAFLLGLWMVSAAMSVCSDAITTLDVCHDGLRWCKGEKTDMALWSEVTEVDINSGVPQTYHGTGLVGAMQAWSAAHTPPQIVSVTIRLRAGAKLVLYAGTLTDFVRLAHGAHERFLENVKQAQHTNLADAFRVPFTSR